MDVIFTSKDYNFQVNTPIVIVEKTLLKNNEKNILNAKICYKNLSGKNISAMMVIIQGKDIWGHEVSRVQEFQYLDLHVANNDEFGDDINVVIDDRNVRAFSVKIVRILYDNGEVDDFSEENRFFSAPQDLFENEQGKDLKKLKEYYVAESKKILSDEQIELEKQEQHALEEKVKRQKKWGILISIISVVSVIVFIVVTILLMPVIKYNKSVTALEQERYTDAIEGFSKSTYRDSERKLKEAYFGLGCQQKDNKEYYEAYCTFKKLNGFSDSKGQMEAVMYLWTTEVLTSDAVPVTFTDAVAEGNYYEVVYNVTVLYLEAHPEDGFWYNEDENITDEGRQVAMVLDLLSGKSEQLDTLAELFRVLESSYDYQNIFEANALTVQKCWDLKFVQNMATNNEAMQYFLIGNWAGSGKYFTMDEKYHTSYNVPWIEEPVGTKYYGIRTMKYCYIDENHNWLADVFRFEIVDYNEINIYSYKNGETYTLYR